MELARGRKARSLREVGKQTKKQLPGLHPRAVEFKGRGGNLFETTFPVILGFPGGRHGFNPWVGKIPLEKGMATCSSILAWRIPMDRGAWRATVCRVAETDMTERVMLSRPVILMLEPLAWRGGCTNVPGSVVFHACLCVKPEVHSPDDGDRAREAVSLCQFQGSWCWYLKLSAFSTTRTMLFLTFSFFGHAIWHVES